MKKEFEKLSEIELLKKCATDPMLAKYKPGQIEASSVACSHFSQALAAVEQQVECDYEKLCVDGRLSKANIVAKHPLLSSRLL